MFNKDLFAKKLDNLEPYKVDTNTYKARLDANESYISMPEKDGQQALKEILALDPGATVIMIAAMGQESIAKECNRNGAEGFLSKPFQEKRVLEALKKILG